ncbi:unnamed protein product [Boreogadus saida]
MGRQWMQKLTHSCLVLQGRVRILRRDTVVWFVLAKTGVNLGETGPTGVLIQQTRFSRAEILLYGQCHSCVMAGLVHDAQVVCRQGHGAQFVDDDWTERCQCGFVQTQLAAVQMHINATNAPIWYRRTVPIGLDALSPVEE